MPCARLCCASQQGCRVGVQGIPLGRSQGMPGLQGVWGVLASLRLLIWVQLHQRRRLAQHEMPGHVVPQSWLSSQGFPSACLFLFGICVATQCRGA